MGRGAIRRLAATGVALVALGPAVATAAKGNVKFGGETDQGRKAKLVADSQGRVVRGTWTVLTDCSGMFEDFRVQIDMRKPLDRSTQDGFRDVASESDSDDTFSARYKHDVDGAYKGKDQIRGQITVDVVFRRDGEKYVTCTAEDLEFTVDELKAS